MHHGTIEAKLRGNLVLVAFGAEAQRGENEAAGLRAAGFLLQFFPEGKIGRCQMHQHGVLRDPRRNLRLVNEDHRRVTVAPSVRRHCGPSLCSGERLPMAMTITISWWAVDRPRNLESRRPSKPSMGQVFSSSASAAIIKFSQANEALLVAHLNSPWRDTGAMPTIFQGCRARSTSHLRPPKTF